MVFCQTRWGKLRVFLGSLAVPIILYEEPRIKYVSKTDLERSVSMRCSFPGGWDLRVSERILCSCGCDVRKKTKSQGPKNLEHLARSVPIFKNCWPLRPTSSENLAGLNPVMELNSTNYKADALLCVRAV